MRKTLRFVLPPVAVSALWLGLSSGCDATAADEPACQRLERLSCECFPYCQTDDAAALNSGDAERCNEQVRATYDYWSPRCANCTQNCEYGWANCAFEVYQEVGLDVYDSCTPGARECDRLRRLSCECFPECQPGDADEIVSLDAERCDTRIRDYHAYWNSSCATCGEECEYGWGECAFEVYTQLELAVQNPCGAPTGT